MKRVFLFILLSVLSFTTVFGQVKTAAKSSAGAISISVHGQKPVLTLKDFESARLVPMASDFALEISLKPEAAKRFAQFSSRHRGEDLEFSLSGQVIKSPLLRVPILDGRISINPVDEDQGLKLVNLINHGERK